MTQNDAAKPPRSLRLGTVGGAPFYLDASWFWGLLLFGVVFMTQLRQQYTGWRWWVMGAVMLATLVVSVILHESAHALAVRRAGYRVVSIVLTLWGGHTSYVTYRPSPGNIAAISLAGPAANFGLALVALLASVVIPPGIGADVAATVMWLNLLLGVFNILPGLPMDGGHALASLGWQITGSRARGQLMAAWGGRVIAAIVGGVAILALLTGNIFSALWMGIFCGFLFASAAAQTRLAHQRRAMEAVTLYQASQPAIVIPADTPLEQAYAWAPRPDQALILSEPDHRLAGVVAHQPTDADTWSAPARNFASPCPSEPFAAVGTEPAFDVAVAMFSDNVEYLPLHLPTGEPRLLSLAQFTRLAGSTLS